MINKIKFLLNYLILFDFNKFRINLYKKKGLRKLIKTKKLHNIRKLKAHMLDIDFSNQFINNKDGVNVDLAISLKQYLNDFLVYTNSGFFQGIYYYFGRQNCRFAYPIPKQWSEVLETNKIKVNHLFCKILWIIYLFYQYILGVMLFLKIIFLCFVSKFNSLLFKKFKDQSTVKNKNYSIFFGDTFKDLGYRFNKNGKLEKVNDIPNLPNWYHNKNSDIYLLLISQNNKKNFYLHDKAFTKNIYDYFLNDLNIISFFLDFLNIQKNIIKNLFFFKWGLIILHRELIISQITRSVRNTPKSIFFYWYSNSYKPLWAKEFEKKNTKVYIYFKSSINSLSEDNNLYFSNETEKDYDYLGFKLYTWSNFLSWNNSLEKIITAKVSSIKKFSVLNIAPYESYFHDLNSSNEKILLPKNSVCVFPNSLPKSNFGITRFNEYFASSEHLLSRFLNDIYDVLLENELKMVLKMKAKKENDEFKRDLKIFDEFKTKDNVIFLTSELPAFKILEKCSGSISLPFSSTALISKNLNKLSAYYDPINFISKNDIFRQDVTLISNNQELSNFVVQIKQKV